MNKQFYFKMYFMILFGKSTQKCILVINGDISWLL